MKEIRAYGEWASPLSAEKVAAAAVRFDGLAADGRDLYWLEARPAESGRYVVVRHRDGRTEDVLPAPYSARSFVHEYGGGSFTVRNGRLLFTNAQDMALYHCDIGESPQLLVSAAGHRFADFRINPAHTAIVSVVEEHGSNGVENRIEWINFSGQRKILTQGCDFYAAPRWSHAGDRVAWLSWDQPNMPWDGTELWTADISAEGEITNVQKVAGGDTEAVQQPFWTRDGRLLFVSDRNGWWNLYRHDGGDITPLAPMESECGGPMWNLGLTTFAELDDGDIVFATADHGGKGLRRRTASGEIHAVTMPLSNIGAVAAIAQDVAVIGGGPLIPASVCWITSSQTTVLKSGSKLTLSEGDISVAEAVEFAGYQGKTSHALVYWPRNQNFEAPSGELPPLLVYAHGGPTSANSSTFNSAVQFWTTRGFAYCAVDYAGSTGYGREYRQRLNGTWGIADIEDCLAAARYLRDSGKVDGRRLLITGGSAGGWVVLCAMAFHDLFAAGASHFGVADLELLAREMHKFEARYFDILVAPYPENAALFRQRSPLGAADQIGRPVIFFQGLEDAVVPPNQSQIMYEALVKRDIPSAYVTYAGEQHGFRRAENIAHSLRAELTFYARILNIEADGMLPDLHIENLDLSA